MIEKIFHVTAQTNSTSLATTLAYMLAAVVLGFLISGIYIFITEKRRRSFSFIISYFIHIFKCKIDTIKYLLQSILCLFAYLVVYLL